MCRASDLVKFLDLGFTPPADAFLRSEQLAEPETYYPLEVVSCRRCGLAQLSYIVSPTVLYRHDYPYEASITRTGRKHWAEFARTAFTSLALSPGELVVDIGSNVGVLLRQFQECGARVLGVDPATNIARIAERNGIETLNDFFTADVAQSIRATHGPAALVTATNVFAHVDDLDAFVAAVKLLLAPDGVFVFEAPYFGNLLAQIEYDTVYHEHLSYLSLKPLLLFFERMDMTLFDVQERDIHGGSFRVFVQRRHGKQAVTPAVGAFLAREQSLGLDRLEVLEAFANAVRDNRQALLTLLHGLKAEGARIAGVSAPAKGMTLLNYCRIGGETLDFVTEKSTLKIGRYTPGTHIPVTDDGELVRRRPDYALLLAWNFADEIIGNLTDFAAAGGRFIVPIPNPRIVASAVAGRSESHEDYTHSQ
jgi:SAM-dependent methyltransferase